ncbi:MAG: UDP-N-acetylmuramate dehydrogenase [Acutalibacteraceae bacterium]|jgi:UDP-N-acetylmuramate dehydrogenase
MTSEQLKQILSAARESDCTVLENEPMNRHTTFRIGGPARLFIKVGTDQALCRMTALCRKLGVGLFVLGSGSNLLVADKGYDGVVLHLAPPDFWRCSREGNEIDAGAAMRLAALTDFAQEQGLSGLEFAYGIPGSVGGAAFMNAGAYGGEMKQVILSCRALLPDGTVQTFAGESLRFGYRTSVFDENGGIVLSARFALTSDAPEAVEERMHDYLNRRRSKQPLEYPSAGSVFKRPEGHFAGALIEQCGLKGVSVGGAQVSEKHAGFIINKGGATCADVCALVEKIQRTVLRETGVSLECEIRRLG